MSGPFIKKKYIQSPKQMWNNVFWSDETNVLFLAIIREDMFDMADHQKQAKVKDGGAAPGFEAAFLQQELTL